MLSLVFVVLAVVSNIKMSPIHVYFVILPLPDIAPVIEGAVQHIASRRLEIGGSDLTKLLVQELGKSNPGVNISTADAEKLKEKFSCCAEDEHAYKKIMSLNDLEEKHTLPDGQVSKLRSKKISF